MEIDMPAPLTKPHDSTSSSNNNPPKKATEETGKMAMMTPAKPDDSPVSPRSPVSPSPPSTPKSARRKSEDVMKEKFPKSQSEHNSYSERRHKRHFSTSGTDGELIHRHARTQSERNSNHTFDTSVNYRDSSGRPSPNDKHRRHISKSMSSNDEWDPRDSKEKER